jgi:hypothetical protein
MLVETLQWLASISATSPNGVPFGRKQKESSMSKYQSIGHRYLSFCWRAHSVGREEAIPAETHTLQECVENTIVKYLALKLQG